MNGVGYFGAISIGLLAGWIAERLLNRSHGPMTNLIMGLVCAVLGGFVVRLSGFVYNGFIPSLIVSVIGAMLLPFLLGVMRRRA